METLYAGCYRTYLDNGLTVLLEPRQDRPLSMGVWARLGSRDEADAQAGITHFLEHMVFKGTETRSAFQISEEIDAIGGAINAMTSREYTAYHVDVLPQHLERAMDVLSDLVRHPRFDPDHVAREKGVILEEIRMQEDTPSDVAFERFDGQLWAEKHPLTRPIAGFAETVNGLTRHDLIDQFSLYDTSQLFLVAVGDVDPDELIRTAEEKFGPLGEAQRDPIPRQAPQLQGGFHLEDRAVQQAHLCLGT
ncbi:MAG: pitrilysin family protein, partial [Halobacteriales archaeon]|nr:pitrilysin family protein [Halobacteriales archaeon]